MSVNLGSIWFCVRHMASEKDNSGVCWEQASGRHNARLFGQAPKVAPGPNCELHELTFEVVGPRVVAVGAVGSALEDWDSPEDDAYNDL